MGPAKRMVGRLLLPSRTFQAESFEAKALSE